MAFCSNCGSQVNGAFCANCGTPAGATSGTKGTGFSSVPPSGSAYVSTGGITENVASALCYLFGFITGIIFLLIAPYNQNRTIRFHAFQSIFLNVAWFACHIVILMLGIMTHGFGLVLSPVIGLLFMLLWLYMMYTAFNNKKIKLPVIGDLAEKQA